MKKIVFLFLFLFFTCEFLNKSEVVLISNLDEIGSEYTDHILIDVRSQDEYDLGHIPNALNFDFYSETFQDTILKLQKNKSIILYCRTNNRSIKTAKFMQENGFKDISVIKGGLIEWVKNGNDINYTTYSK
tara:strand:- start:391 stop:783 length:393 start_codon:yes stop_codon:yes gene_type:complete